MSDASQATPALETKALCKSFGALSVASTIDFSLARGARQALIGPNGAGKTSFINLVTGVLAPSDGRILLEGADITSLSQAQRVKRGIARTFQITALFRGLTVLENVTLAVSERMGMAGDLHRPAGSRRAIVDEGYALLASLGLEADALRPVRELAYGRQRLVEIVVALGLEPKVLLLDEPAAGVPHEESGEIFEAVASLSGDLTLLFIEHDMHVVFRFATHIIVLVGGAIFTEGSPAEIAADPGVREVYLGTRKHG